MQLKAYRVYSPPPHVSVPRLRHTFVGDIGVSASYTELKKYQNSSATRIAHTNRYIPLLA